MWKWIKSVWCYYIAMPKKYRQYLLFKQSKASKKDMLWAKQRVVDYKKEQNKNA